MDMDDDIRLATPADTAVVEEIVQRAYQPWVGVIGRRPIPMDSDQGAFIAAGQGYVIGADRVDALIVLIPEDDALLIENVAVRPELHGRGVGRRLLAFAEAEAVRSGLPAVRLYTNAKMARNIGLYTALGYAETGRQTMHEGTFVIVHMRKELPAAVDPAGL